jgi:fatty-acid desaturase
MNQQSADSEGQALLSQREARSQLPTSLALLAIHLIALAAFLPQFTNWSAVAVGAVLYFMTGCLGITLGFHRLLTHRSMRVPRALECFLAICGTLALQGGPIEWISTHRIHHKYSDTPLDPHDSNKGFWWSHIGWLIFPNPAKLTSEEEVRFAHDLASDGFYRFLERGMIPMQIVLGLALFAAGGWSWVIWGIFVRLVLVYHITWFVNSAAHETGYQSYASKDRSTNSWWVAILAWGEGWHNNHHAFPFSARHGLKWYEFDLTWLAISALERLGLAKDVKLPSEAMLKRREVAAKAEAKASAPKVGVVPVLDRT